MDDKKTVIAYKGFDLNWQCRGYQFEVGKTYTHNGDVEVCSSGFHACECPMDCFTYYDPTTSKYAVVELSGLTDRHEGDTKIVSASISVKAEINIAEIVRQSVAWIKQLAASSDPAKPASGNYSNLAASGNYSNLAASGNYSNLAASGDSSNLAASGNYSKLAASGEKSLVMGAYLSRAKVGKDGAIALAWIDKDKRPRISVAYEGENGIKADVLYSLNDDGEFVVAA